MHVGDVVLHLGDGAHAGQHRDDTVEARDVTDRPAGETCRGVRLPQDRCDGLGRVGQHAALDGLHDHDGLPVPAGHLIVRPARHAGVLPVGIVELQLDEVHLGVRRQNLVEKLWVGMERETVVLDQALLLELRREVPDVIPVIDGVVVLLDGMEQVVVEVASPGPLKRGVELLLGALFVVAAHPRTELGG